MIQKKWYSGTIQTSHGPKKHVKVGAMSSQCWLFFSIVRVLCTTNLLQEVRRSTKNITVKFWKDCIMPWEENDRVSRQAVTDFFTTITRQRIHRTLCSNFWRNTRLYSFASQPYSPNIAPCDFWMFPKFKMALKGRRFDDIETIQSNATRELKAIPKSAFKDCLRCGSTAGSMWFNQMRNTSKDATVRTTRNSTNVEIWTQVGYFLDTPRISQAISNALALPLPSFLRLIRYSVPSHRVFLPQLEHHLSDLSLLSLPPAFSCSHSDYFIYPF